MATIDSSQIIVTGGAFQLGKSALPILESGGVPATVPTSPNTTALGWYDPFGSVQFLQRPAGNNLSVGELQCAIYLYMGQTFAAKFWQDFGLVAPPPVAGIGLTEISIVAEGTLA